MKVGRVFRSIISGTILLLPIFAAPAFANSITASVPQAGSVLTTAPNSIAISTAAVLSEQGSSIVVNDPKLLKEENQIIKKNIKQFYKNNIFRCHDILLFDEVFLF